MGCGEEFYAIYLASKGFEVIGIDLSENAIRLASENAAKRDVKIRHCKKCYVIPPDQKYEAF